MFFKNSTRKLERILNEIVRINKIPINTENNEKIEQKTKKLHSIISSFLFHSLKIKNYEIMDLIIKNDFVRADLILNEKGLDIVQHSLLEHNNDLFKLLVFKYYKYITCYFNDASCLFMLILNKKNFDLIEVFLTKIELYKQLKKENISVCLYLLIKENKDDLVKLLLLNKELEEQLDGRDIQSLLIYFISNNHIDKIKKIFEFEIIIDKCDETYLKNLIALSIMNKNIEALSIMIENPDILKIILSDNKILKNVVLFAYNSSDLRILSIISKNKTTCNLSNKNQRERTEIKNIIKLKTTKILEDSI